MNYEFLLDKDSTDLDGEIVDGNMTVDDYQRAIDEYRRRLGEEFFEENEGMFWMIHKTRPFMPYVVPYLTGKKKIPLKLPQFYSPGDKNEAIFYFLTAESAWKSDRKAMRVLKKLSKT